MIANTCPYCKSRVKVQKFANISKAPFSIRCDHCGLKLSQTYSSLQDAIAIWNALYP